jgi:hypothetical protein
MHTSPVSARPVSRAPPSISPSTFKLGCTLPYLKLVVPVRLAVGLGWSLRLSSSTRTSLVVLRSIIVRRRMSRALGLTPLPCLLRLFTCSVILAPFWYVGIVAGIVESVGISSGKVLVGLFRRWLLAGFAWC